MTTAADLPARPLTLDDVTRIAESDHRHRFELAEGNLVVMPPGTWRHQEISGLNGRIPDLVVTTGPVPDDTVWLSPDAVALAVEIVSKGSERTDHWLKPVEYAEAGIPLFWRVEPDGTVAQFRLDGNRYVQYGGVALEELLRSAVPDLSSRAPRGQASWPMRTT